MSKKFAFDNFERCYFHNEFLDKGTEVWYTVLTDGSYMLTMCTAHNHERITESYPSQEAFEEDFYTEKDNGV